MSWHQKQHLAQASCSESSCRSCSVPVRQHCTTTLHGQGCKAALPKPPFSVSQPMAHLCLSGAFMKVEALKGALLFFHGQGGSHFPRQHRTSTERREKPKWGSAACYAEKGRAAASCSVLCRHKAAVGRLGGWWWRGTDQRGGTILLLSSSTGRDRGFCWFLAQTSVPARAMPCAGCSS